MDSEDLNTNIIEEGVAVAYYYDQYEEQVIEHLNNIETKQNTIIQNINCCNFLLAILLSYIFIHNMLRRV